MGRSPAAPHWPEPPRRAASALYEAPFEFTGKLKRVTVTLDAPQGIDGAGLGQAEMARQ